MAGFPNFYILYIINDIRSRGLLPPSGSKTRAVAFFFIGVTTIFLAVWMPAFLMMFVIGSFNSWIIFVVGVWSHSQGIITAAFALLRLEIRKAFTDFICCKTRQWSIDLNHEENTNELADV